MPERPKPEILIIVDGPGNVRVRSNMTDLFFLYGVLERAKDALREQLGSQPPPDAIIQAPAAVLAQLESSGK